MSKLEEIAKNCDSQQYLLGMNVSTAHAFIIDSMVTYVKDMEMNATYAEHQLYTLVALIKAYKTRHGRIPCDTLQKRDLACQMVNLSSELSGCFTSFNPEQIKKSMEYATNYPTGYRVLKLVRFTIEELRIILPLNSSLYYHLPKEQKLLPEVVSIQLRCNPNTYDDITKLGVTEDKWLFYAMAHGYKPDILWNAELLYSAPREYKMLVAQRLKLRSNKYFYAFVPQSDHVFHLLRECNQLPPSRWFRINTHLRDDMDIQEACVKLFTSHRKLMERFTSSKMGRWYPSFALVRCRRCFDTTFHFK